jgi:hypothetical protein
MGEGAEGFQVRASLADWRIEANQLVVIHTGASKRARTLAGLRQPTSPPWNPTGPAWAEGACRGMFGSASPSSL